MSFSYEIVGTSHVAEESSVKIRQRTEAFKPDIICVELDHQRLQGLLEQQTRSMSPRLIFKIGLTGFIFAWAAQKAQKHLGKKLDISPGQDMLSAVRIAQEKQIKFALIDQNIQITLKKLSRGMRFKDKWHIFVDILEGIFRPKKALRKILSVTGSFDLRTIPGEDIVKNMMNYTKKRYPGIYQVLVHERNIFMVDRIYALFKKEPTARILVVVGAGHKEGMEKLLKEKLLKLEYIS